MVIFLVDLRSMNGILSLMCNRPINLLPKYVIAFYKFEEFQFIKNNAFLFFSYNFMCIWKRKWEMCCVN